MADGYIKAAEEYATQAANTYRNTFDNTLQDLLTTRYNLQKEQATNNYNNLLNKIDANRTNLREQYKTNARQAYVNKLLADRQTTDTLSRMNLNQSGFRLTQDTLTNNRYDASLNNLAMAMNAGERDLDTQALDALNAHNTNLLNLDIDYNSKLGELLQDKENKIQEYYNTAYDRYIADRQYQDQLKQQQFENNLKQQQLSLSASASGSGSHGASGGNMAYDKNKGAMTSGSNDSSRIMTLKTMFESELFSNKDATNWWNDLTNKLQKSNNKISYDAINNEITAAYNDGILDNDDVRLVLSIFEMPGALDINSEQIKNILATRRKALASSQSTSNTTASNNKPLVSRPTGTINNGALVNKPNYTSKPNTNYSKPTSTSNKYFNVPTPNLKSLMAALRNR